MKLWLISQVVNDGYDTYSDAVIAAESEYAARLVHPGGIYSWRDGKWMNTRKDGSTYEEGQYGTWANPDQVMVEYLGNAKSGTVAGIICSSFHAG